MLFFCLLLTFLSFCFFLLIAPCLLPLAYCPLLIALLLIALLLIAPFAYCPFAYCPFAYCPLLIAPCLLPNHAPLLYSLRIFNKKNFD